MFVPPAMQGFSPLDDELGLLPGTLTPRLQESLVRLSTWIPSFAKASAELTWFTGATVSRDTTRRLTEAAGAAAVNVQTAEVERIEQEYPLPPPGPARLVFHVDGAMVPLVRSEWAEVRTLAVGEVAAAVERAGEMVSATERLSYFSRLADSATFSRLSLGELHRRGIETARQVGVVVDGAEWCQTLIDLQAPLALRILDLPHAAEYISAMGQTSVAGLPLLSPADVAALCHALSHQGPTAVLPRLRALCDAHPDLPALAKQYAYLAKRTAQMQYPVFRAAGWPLGSGSVESANKLVVEDRLKGSGMHWARQNVNPLLALRNAVCNDRWDEVWTQIEADQRQQAHDQRQQRRLDRRTERCAPDAPAPSVGGVGPLAHAADELHPVLVPPPLPARSPHRPAIDHPWRRAWSKRQQAQQSHATT